MKHWWIAAALVGALGMGDFAHAAEEHSLERSADRLLVGIPVAAFGLTFVLERVAPDAISANSFLGYNFVSMNGSPRHDLSLALLRTGAITYGLKAAIDEERPNGADTDSFPSGHTAVTFAGAEFVRKEYGWAWGAPAYVAASFVGWTRIATDDHWSHDVLVGAAIGILSNYDLGDLRTRFGDWSVKPSMFATAVGPPGALQETDHTPGLRMELRF